MADRPVSMHPHVATCEVRDCKTCDSPEGLSYELPSCSYPHRNHGDGRGCEMDDCPRHGEPRERPWEYVLGEEDLT